MLEVTAPPTALLCYQPPWYFCSREVSNPTLSQPTFALCGCWHSPWTGLPLPTHSSLLISYVQFFLVTASAAPYPLSSNESYTRSHLASSRIALNHIGLDQIQWRHYFPSLSLFVLQLLSDLFLLVFLSLIFPPRLLDLNPPAASHTHMHSHHWAPFLCISPLSHSSSKIQAHSPS